LNTPKPCTAAKIVCGNAANAPPAWARPGSSAVSPPASTPIACASAAIATPMAGIFNSPSTVPKNLSTWFTPASFWPSR
jgi:hypothetical protein